MAMQWQGRAIAVFTATLAFACGSSLDSPASHTAMTAAADEPAPPEPEPASATNTGKPAGDAFIIDLSGGYDEETQYLSDYEMDEDWIRIAFRPRNARFGKDGMTLLLEKTGGRLPFFGAEFQRTGNYGYGRYEAVLTATGAYGAVSSFFTHTDSYFDDPHDEIDFEFMGRNPRMVHLNYFRNGDSDALDISLWFDASERDHLYAFEWAPDSIRWYIDGEMVREVLASDTKVGIPRASGRVIANIWAGAGGSAEWAGEPRFTRASAMYRCISHVPIGKTGAQCSDSFTPPPKP